MKIRLFLIGCLLSFNAWSQPMYTAIIMGAVIDSSTGTPMPNYPVMISDSSNAMGGGSLTVFTDANGNYMDTLSLFSTAGIILIQTEDSCSGNWLTHTFAYTPNNGSVFTVYDTFYICGSTGTGGGTGGGSNAYCAAAFTFDTVLTGNGQIVLYNTSTMDSMFNFGTVNYQWFWGDGTTSTGAFPSHQYTQSGTFSLCLEQTAIVNSAMGTITCTSTFCDTIAIDSTGNISYKGVSVMVNVYSPEEMSLEESTADLFTLFPNPSSDWVQLKTTQPGEFVVSDLMGRIVFTKHVEGALTLPPLPKGTYVVRARMESATLEQILIIQ